MRAAWRGVDVVYFLVHSLVERRTSRPPTAGPRTIVARRRATPGCGGSSTSAACTPDRSAVAAPRVPRRGRRDPAAQRRADRRAARRRRSSAPARPASRCCATSPSGCRSWSRRAGSAPASSRSPSATCCATSSGRACLPDDVNRAFDIGGPDVLTYREMMQRYAGSPGCRGGRSSPVPVLTPRLSAHWVNLVTPVPRAIAAR